MTTHELIYAIIAAVSAISGFIFEWKRSGTTADRIAALKAANLDARVSALEAWSDRVRRAA